MNGKPAEKVHIVEKTRAVNKKVNKKFQKKDDWGFVPSFYIDGLRMLWNVLLIPVVLIAAVLEGIRAGFVAGMSKALSLYK
jgi:hypothetical protein